MEQDRKEHTGNFHNKSSESCTPSLSLPPSLPILCRSLGIDSEVISPEECARICPVLRTDDLYAGLYNADDVCAGDPSDICRSLAKGAQLQGRVL